jgi:hypothetical protein
MSSYRGAQLVAIDLQTQILWTPEMKLRKETLMGVIGHARQVHIRIPFNPVINENQLEFLIDAILELGFVYRGCVTSQYGQYYQTWIFSL